MRRNPPREPDALQLILGPAGAGLPIEQRLAMLQALRSEPDASGRVDVALLERIEAMARGLQLAQQRQGELQAIVTRLTALPWSAAVVLHAMGTNGTTRVLVRHGHADRVVSLCEEMKDAQLAPGEEVYLGPEMNVILAKAPVSRPGAGPTCLFERKTDDHRLVVKCRDEIALVLAPPGLLAADLKPGDLLRWIPDALVAIERVDHAQDSAFFLEAAPDVTFDNIGGLDDAIGRILDILDIHWFHPEAARRFRLPRKGSLLLVGPAGNGKTMIGKALANLLGQRTCGGRAHFLNIKPGALHSVWYSQSEANYREVFRVARELGEKDPATPVVMFLDEVDAIGVARGHSHMRVHDTVLTALIAELDGLAERGNILVVAATNRREALDPALLRPGRLGDIILEVPRPGLRGARQIFAKHLPEDIPYAVNGQGADSKAQREELIDRAVSRLFAPNAGHELATLTFRDNRRRPVRPADLVSGAVIANISLAAREQASLRCRNAGDVGLRLEDLLDAIEREFDAAAGVLTPANCRNFLTDLPYDADIVNVERPLRRPAATHRFINLE